jgi:hypothetical protein
LFIRLTRGSAFTRAIVMWRDLHQRLARIEASQVEHAPVPGIKPMKLCSRWRDARPRKASRLERNTKVSRVDDIRYANCWR